MTAQTGFEDLIATLRSEANISGRPGSYDRLNAVADALSARLPRVVESTEEES